MARRNRERVRKALAHEEPDRIPFRTFEAMGQQGIEPRIPNLKDPHGDRISVRVLLCPEMDRRSIGKRTREVSDEFGCLPILLDNIRYI